VRELLNELSETPRRVSALVDAFRGDPRRKPSDDAFSVLENVCHLRDIERLGYTPRIARMLAEPDPFLPDVDGARVAADADYNGTQDLRAAMAELVALREANVARLESLTDAEWQRAGELEGAGRITLRDLVRKMIEHDRGHIAEIEALNEADGG